MRRTRATSCVNPQSFHQSSPLAGAYRALPTAQEDHKTKNYPLALITWFSPAMWPVVTHQGMIQHEETPGSYKKQATRGAYFTLIVFLVQIQNTRLA